VFFDDQCTDQRCAAAADDEDIGLIVEIRHGTLPCFTTRARLRARTLPAIDRFVNRDHCDLAIPTVGASLSLDLRHGKMEKKEYRLTLAHVAFSRILQ